MALAGVLALGCRDAERGGPEDGAARSGAPASSPTSAAERASASAPAARAPAPFSDRGPPPRVVPAVQMGAAKVDGALDPEAVQRVLRPSWAVFVGCYEAALVRDPHLTGRVVTRFVIGVDGGPTQVQSSADPPPGDPGLLDCVAKEIGRQPFPPPKRGTAAVTYPLVFDLPTLINGRRGRDVSLEDLKAAISAASWAVLEERTKDGYPEVTVLRVKKGPTEVVLTFDPFDTLEGNSSTQRWGIKHTSPEYQRLRSEAALLIEGSLTLAAESPDKVAAQALLDAIGRKSAR